MKVKGEYIFIFAVIALFIYYFFIRNSKEEEKALTASEKVRKIQAEKLEKGDESGVINVLFMLQNSNAKLTAKERADFDKIIKKVSWENKNGRKFAMIDGFPVYKDELDKLLKK